MRLNVEFSLLLIAFSAGCLAYTLDRAFEGNLHARPYYELRFISWMREFNKLFHDSEYEKRLRVFAASDDYIHHHNSKPDASYTLAHNAYSHLTWEEFKEHFSIGVPLSQDLSIPFESLNKNQVVQSRKLSSSELADEVDWVPKGAVTAVKNQGQCGSCWSFSATGAMEGAYFLKTGELKSFSEQELVDCDRYDNGCGGGLMDYAFNWIKENGGICLEDDYSYEARDGFCKMSKCTPVPGTKVSSWVDVEESMEALMEAVMQQPVAIAIEADQMAFQFYSGGVLTAPCGTTLDHGVLLVGYGTSEDGIDYWKIKNSWGAEWGDNGYIRIIRGADQEGGECGILESASYPLLE